MSTDHPEGPPEAWVTEATAHDGKCPQRQSGEATGRRHDAAVSKFRRVTSSRGASKVKGARVAKVDDTSWDGTKRPTKTSNSPGSHTPDPVRTKGPRGSRLRRFNYVHSVTSKQQGAGRISTLPRPVLPAWKANCYKNFPGSFPLQGAVESSAQEIGALLEQAYARQERDYVYLGRGVAKLKGSQLEFVVARVNSISKELADVENTPPRRRRYASVDTSILAIVNAGRFVGAVVGKRMAPWERALLPAVCLCMAFKLGETRPENDVYPQLVACNARDSKQASVVKKQLVMLEWKVCNALRWMIHTETPVTFLHLYVARAVSEGALAQAQAVSLGFLATRTAVRWTLAGFLSEFKSSELAAVALHCAVLRDYGAATAGKVAEGIGCARTSGSSRFYPMYRDGGFSNLTAMIRSTGADDGIERETGGCACGESRGGVDDRDEAEVISDGSNYDVENLITPTPSPSWAEAIKEAIFREHRVVA